MVVSGLLPVFLCACFGGTLAELLKWYQLRDSPDFPIYVRGPVYWVTTLLMTLAGGALAVLYGTEPKSAILVLHIGLSAPLIIKTLAETSINPSTNTTPSDQTPGRSMTRRGPRRGHPLFLAFLAGR